MNPKAMIFWIASGVLLLALFGALVFVQPSDEAGTAADYAKKLSGKVGELKRLSDRAAKGSPQGRFDPENEEDIQRLTGDYIVTERWKQVVDPHVAKYDEQVVRIREWLIARSKGLHKVVADTDSKLEWYNAYMTRSEEVLAQMRKARCVILPAREKVADPGAAPMGAVGPGMPPGVGMPGAMPVAAPVPRPAPGVAPAAAPVPVSAAPAADEGSPAAERSVIGLFTKAGDLPDPKEHARLSLRLRVIEYLCESIMASKARIEPNPLVPVQILSAEYDNAVAAVSAWEWRDPAAPLTGTYTGLAQTIGVGLTFQGPVAALSAVLANFERNAGDDVPLWVVQGGTLTRKEAFAIGERKDAPSEWATLRLDLLVLDFTDMPEPGKEPPPLPPGTQAAGPAQQMGDPGMMGMPPGMMPGMMPGMGPGPGMGPPPAPEPATKPRKGGGRQKSAAGEDEQ